MTAAEYLLVQHIWIGMLLWTLLFVTDYALTIWGARLHAEVGRKHVDFAGSYELVPAYQKDVDQQRTFSPRFAAVLVLGMALLPLIRWLSTGTRYLFVPEVIPFVIGVFALRSMVAIKGHIRNIAFYNYVRRHPGAVQGHLAYTRKTVMRVSAVDFLASAGLYAFASIVTGSWFFAGGALSCMATAARLRLWERRAPAAVSASDADSELNSLG